MTFRARRAGMLFECIRSRPKLSLWMRLGSTRLGRVGHVRAGNPGLSPFLPRCRGKAHVA